MRLCGVKFNPTASSVKWWSRDSNEQAGIVGVAEWSGADPMESGCHFSASWLEQGIIAPYVSVSPSLGGIVTRPLLETEPPVSSEDQVR